VGNGISAFFCLRLALLIGTGKPLFLQNKKVPFSMLLPIVVLSLGAGFWITGMHPFSSEGWLSNLWSVPGKSLHPDVPGLVLGAILAWRFTWKRQWKPVPVSPGMDRVLMEFSWFQQLGRFTWNSGLWTSSQLLKVDRNFLDCPLDLSAKAVVVGGYFVSFFDRFVVDGLVLWFTSTMKNLGGFLWNQSRSYPQYVVWFATTVLLVIIYFSLFN